MPQNHRNNHQIKERTGPPHLRRSENPSLRAARPTNQHPRLVAKRSRPISAALSPPEDFRRQNTIAAILVSVALWWRWREGGKVTRACVLGFWIPKYTERKGISEGDSLSRSLLWLRGAPNMTACSPDRE